MEIREELRASAARAAPSIIVKTRPSNGTAAVLSLLLPGAGQMYKGKVGQGVVWLGFTLLGYLLIFPGLMLHLVCIFHAASMEPADS